MVVGWRREGSNALVVGHFEAAAFELRGGVVRYQMEDQVIRSKDQSIRAWPRSERGGTYC